MMGARRGWIRTILMYGLLGGIAIAMLLPLLWMLSTALKVPPEDIFQFPPKFIPDSPSLQNFRDAWQKEPFDRYFFNSVVIATATTVLNLLICSLGAYPLARLSFRGREPIFLLIVATILIPFQIVMIPLYIDAVRFGLLNTYLGAIFPFIASAFGIFLMRQAFQTVPKELEEAARIDGCSELGIWWHIMMPSVRPALVTLALFVFIGSWGDFLWPLLVLDRPEYYTLPLGVNRLSGSFSNNWRLISAGSIISIVPVILVFIAAQRYIVPSETGSGVKG